MCRKFARNTQRNSYEISKETSYKTQRNSYEKTVKI